MKTNIMKIFLALIIIVLTVSPFGIATAGSEVSISGIITEDGQLVDSNGMIYDIAENEAGNEIMEMTGHNVTVKGTLMEAEGASVITISSFKVTEE